MLDKTSMLPEKSVLNKITLRVDDIYDWIGVPLMTRREYCHFKILIYTP